MDGLVWSPGAVRVGSSRIYKCVTASAASAACDGCEHRGTEDEDGIAWHLCLSGHKSCSTGLLSLLEDGIWSKEKG